MSATLSSLLLATVLLMSPPRETSEPGPQPAPDNALAIAVAGMWQDAEIGTTADYQAKVHNAGEYTVGPADMRKLVLQGNEGQLPSRMSPGTAIIFSDDRVTLSWGGSFHRKLKVDAAAGDFGRALGELGYTRVEDANEVKRLTQGKTGADGKPKSVYARKLGKSQSAVVFETQNLGTASEVRFGWMVSRELANVKPTLPTVFAALPAWARVKYFSDKFYDKFADEPLVSLSSGDGFSITFAQPLEARLTTALEAEGFDFFNEHSPTPDGTVQKVWRRHSDTTYAGVRIPADGKTITFYSQSPQNKADPTKPKPPPRHPVTTLPHEKRPKVAFDKLVFDNAELREVAKRSHDLGESLKQEKWVVEYYQDFRRDWDPLFMGNWRTPKINPNGMGYLPRDLPFRGVAMSLRGKHVAGVDRLTAVGVSGTLVPLQGWAAKVSCTVEVDTTGNLKRSLGAAIGIVAENSIPRFAFDAEPGRCISLGRRWVRAHASKDHFAYDLYAQTETEPDFKKMETILDTEPEALRDYLLGDIELLRKIARENLETGKRLSTYDQRDVRSARPPEPRAVQGELPEEVKKLLWNHVEQQLTADENLIRTGFREAHAAIKKALPLEVVLGDAKN